MADIRTVPLQDDFNRANEDPVQPPWVKASAGTWAANMHITSTNLVGHAGDSMYRWTTQSFSNTIEVWGESDSLADITEGWRMALLDGSANGYAMRYAAGIGNDQLTINRVTGGAQTLIFNNPDTFYGAFTDYWMMRLTETSVEIWLSLTDVNTWFLAGSAADTTYRSGLFPCLGISSDDGTGPWWRGMGAGELREFIPQIYRRPTE